MTKLPATDLLAETDITEFKETDHNNDLFFFIVKESNDRFHYISPSFHEFTGFSHAFFAKSYLKDIFHPDDYHLLLKQIAKISMGITSSWKESYRIRHKNGVWIRIENTLIKCSGENRDHYIGMARNLTNISEINIQEKSALDKTYQQIRNFFQTIASKMISGKSQKKTDIEEDFIITRRELEVLKLLADGYPANEIADKLFISKYTVINHRKNLISKFKARNTAELIKKAIKSHWI